MIIVDNYNQSIFNYLDDDLDAEGGDSEEPRADGEGPPEVGHEGDGRGHEEGADGQRAQVPL